MHKLEDYTSKDGRYLRHELDRSVHIDDFVRVQHEWAERNFGSKRPSWHALLGLQEEVGKLAHAYLKREQGVRGTELEHREKMIDAVADIFIFLVDFCNLEKFDLDWAIREVWSSVVSKRDWKANPTTGVASDEDVPDEYCVQPLRQTCTVCGVGEDDNAYPFLGFVDAIDEVMSKGVQVSFCPRHFRQLPTALVNAAWQFPKEKRQ